MEVRGKGLFAKSPFPRTSVLGCSSALPQSWRNVSAIGFFGHVPARVFVRARSAPTAEAHVVASTAFAFKLAKGPKVLEQRGVFPKFRKIGFPYASRLHIKIPARLKLTLVGHKHER